MINHQFLVGISRFTWVVVSLTMLAGTQALADAASVFVKTTTVQRGLLTESLRAYGSVVASPAAVRNVSATRAGEIGAVEVLAGAEVIKGQALLEFRNDPSVTAAHSQAATAVGLARGDLQRTEGLFALKLATESQLAAAKKALADARGNLAALASAGGGRRSEVLRAPFAGTVSSIAVQSGDRIQAGAPMLQLQQAGATRIVLGVAPEQVAQLKAGGVVSMQTAGQPGAALQGRVGMVHGAVDPQTRLLGVEVVADRGSRALVVGTSVSAVIATAAVDGWIVPRSAVLRDDDGAYVFVVRASRAQRIAVRIVGETTAHYAIEGAMPVQPSVVVEGNYELSDGMPVREAQTR